MAVTAGSDRELGSFLERQKERRGRGRFEHNDERPALKEGLKNVPSGYVFQLGSILTSRVIQR